MRMPIKKLWVAGALVLVLGALGAALFWSRSGGGFATPDDCLSAYYEACRAGDVGRYLQCLGEPLRSQSRPQLGDADVATETLHRQAVRGWVRNGQAESAERAVLVNVEEVRTSGIHRVQFRLERSTGGWLIVAMTPLEERAPLYPYGTDVRGSTPER